MPDIEINKWIETFHQYKFDKLSFEPLFKRALLILKDAWLRCIKEDVDRFTSAYYLIPSPSESINESEDEEDEVEETEVNEDKEQTQVLTIPKEQTQVVTIPKKQIPRLRSGDTQIRMSNDMIYIKRPWLNRFVPSASSERRERLIEALENAMTEGERKRLRAEKIERLRKIEENRKKALKAARERQKKQLNEKEGGATSISTKTVPTRRQTSGFYIDKILPSKTTTLSKDSQRLILNNFQHYIRLSKTAPARLENKLSLTFEIAKVFQ
jgi:hypothetical protein